MDDLFNINYIVRWYRGDDEIGMASVDGLSYTVTRLTATLLPLLLLTLVVELDQLVMLP